MQGAKKGVLSLDDPIFKFFPEWEHHLVFDEDDNVRVCEVPITIQHLLNMTSGVPYPGPDTPGGVRMAQLEQNAFAATASGQKLTTQDMCRLIMIISCCAFAVFAVIMSVAAMRSNGKKEAA